MHKKKLMAAALSAALVFSACGGPAVSAVTTTSSVPGSVVQMLQAEDAAITGQCQVMQNYFTASRLACVGKVDDTSSTVTFTLEAPEAGRYLIQLCTGSGSDQVNAGYRYWTNGDEENAQIVRFHNYGWETWRLYDVYVDLQAGENTFTVSHTGEEKSYTQIDFIKFWSFPTPAASLTADGEAFAELDIQQQAYYYLVDSADLPELACELADSQRNFGVEVEQPAGLNQAGTVTLTCRNSPDCAYTYTVWFCDEEHYMARFQDKGTTVMQYEAEDAVLTGSAVTRGSREGSYLNATCSGNEWVSGLDNADAAATFTLEAPADGEYLVKVALDSFSSAADPGLRYWVNGEESAARTAKFDIPEGEQFGDNWFLFPIYVNLREGENTLTFSHDGGESSTCELDYIRFFACPAPDAAITLDGTPLSGFSRDEWDYDTTVSGDTLPTLGYSGQGLEEIYDITVTQPAGFNQAGKVVFALKDHPGYTFTYNVDFYDENASGSLVINDGGDPWVTYHDGYYYYINTQGGAFYVCKSADLTDLNTNPVKVYTPDEAAGEPTREIWAPELHYIQGEWYIYYAAYHNGGNNNNHRGYVLKGTSQDPQDPFTFVGQIYDATDKWMIDMTVVEIEEELYAVWSGWEKNVDGEQALYIAHMDSPTHIDSQRVMISYPDEEFERLSTNPYVNEGPAAVIAPDGTVNIVYSANHFSNGAHYRLGVLTLKKGADPMDAASWMKSADAVFQSNPETGIYSVGHPSFTTSPDGTENYILFHGRDGSSSQYSRRVYLQTFTFDEKGVPTFEKPLGSTGMIKQPSGTDVIPSEILEAETGALSGGAAVTTGDARYLSGGAKVTGLNSGGSVSFTVEAPSDGAYTLALYAAQSSDYRTQSGLQVSVGGDTFDRQIIGRGNDAYFWYTLSVPLRAGQNTLTISGSSAYAHGADLDCIRLSTMSEEDYAAQEPAQPAASLSESELAMEAGDTVQLQMEITPRSDSITWTSSDPAVAVIDAYGRVTAVGDGEAVITLRTASGAEASCRVTVGNQAAPTVTLDKTALTLPVGGTGQLTAAAEPAGDALTWASDNPAAATVDANGLVTALASGAARITVTTASGAEAVCQVTVYLPGDLTKDGTLDIQDVMSACRVLARQTAGGLPTDEELLLGDMDGGGVLDIQDIMSICRALARQNQL